MKFFKNNFVKLSLLFLLEFHDKPICCIGHEKVNIMYMRLHVSKHILHGETKGQV